MIRVVFEDILLFLLPFLAFGLVLVLLRRDVLHLGTWSRSSFWLVLAGFAVVIGWTLWAGLFSERHRGAYIPPHMENGRPVQGGFE